MAFDDIWNTSYEGIPPDSENVNLGANRIRDFKRNVRERGGVDHSWGDTADNGQHNQVTFNQATADPATVAATGYLYTKAVGGVTELFYKDSAGHVEQLTNNGVINVVTFPSGTVMSFLQATPPTGWTQSGAWNDAMIRLVGDVSGGTVGGSWTISGCTISTTVSTTVNTTTSTNTTTGTSVNDNGSTVSISVGGHSLSELELPPHTHGMTLLLDPTAGTIPGQGTGGAGPVTTAGIGYRTDNGFGTSSPHIHPGSGTLSLRLAATSNSTSTSTSSSTASSTGSSSLASNSSWRPLYINACVGVKT